MKYSSRGAIPNGGNSEHSNEPTASIREGKFIDQLSYNYRYLLEWSRTMDVSEITGLNTSTKVRQYSAPHFIIKVNTSTDMIMSCCQSVRLVLNEQEARQTQTRTHISPSKSLKSVRAFEYIKRILCKWKQIQFEKQARFHTSMIKRMRLWNKTNIDTLRLTQF